MARLTPSEIRKNITEKMINALQQGTIPWRQPWSTSENVGVPRSFHANRRYTGINPLLLSLEAYAKGFHSCQWGTASSWTKYLGGVVKPGEQSSIVVLFRLFSMVDKNGKTKSIPWLTEFEVYNVEQIVAPTVAELLDGRCSPGGTSFVGMLLNGTGKGRAAMTSVGDLWKLVQKYVPKSKHPGAEAGRQELAELIHQRIDTKLQKYRVVEEIRNMDPGFEPADELIKATQANIHYGGTKAYYHKTADKVHLPRAITFDSISDFYETTFHELAHWARSSSRVPPKKLSTYAFEELVAEISACFVMMELGVPMADNMLEKSQSYVQGWLKHMQDDPKYIFEASQEASRVVDFLLAFTKQKAVA